MKNRLIEEIWWFVGITIIVLAINVLWTWKFGGSMSRDVVLFLIIYIIWRIGWNLGYNECYEERYKQGLENGMHDLLVRIKMFFLESKHGDLYELFLKYIYESTKHEPNHFEETDGIIAEKMEEHFKEN